jgi:integrase
LTKFQKDDYTHWLLDFYDDNINHKLRPITIYNMRSNIKIFSKWLDASAVPGPTIDLLKVSFEGEELNKKQRMQITGILKKWYEYQKNTEKAADSTIRTRLTYVINFMKSYHIDAYYDDLKFKGKPKAKHGQRALKVPQMRDFVALHNTDLQKTALFIRISTGCRVGAIGEMRFKDIIEYDENCMLVRIYPDEEDLDKPLTTKEYRITGQEEYLGFLTPEATRVFKAYKKKIKRELGESFNEDLGLDGKPVKADNQGKRGGALSARLITYAGLKLKKMGLKEGSGKRDFHATHHTRKYADTILKDAATEHGLDKQLIEFWFVGHLTGLDDAYRDVDVEKYYNEFKKFIPFLTINEIEAADISDRFKESKNEKKIENLTLRLEETEKKRELDNNLLLQFMELWKQGLSYEEAAKKLKFPKNFYE